MSQNRLVCGSMLMLLLFVFALMSWLETSVVRLYIRLRFPVIVLPVHNYLYFWVPPVLRRRQH